MKTDILCALRRQRGRWFGTSLIWGTAAIGVAMFVALAAVVDGLLLKQPFEGAERVVVLGRPHDRFGIVYEMTRPEITDASSQVGVQVAAMSRPRSLGRWLHAPLATQVSTNFFDVVRIRPVLGRTFGIADEGLTERAVISETLWRTRFGGEPDIVDRSVIIGDSRVIVVGVVPAPFGVPAGTNVWTPWELRSNVPYMYRALTRFADGASLSTLQTRLSGWQVVSLRDYLAPRDASHALILLGAGALMLCAVWTYFGLIQAGEAVRRAGETHLRLALGAGRWRAIRAPLVEAYLSLVVCLAAGAALAPAILVWLLARLPPALLAGHPIALGGRTVVVVLVVLLAGVVVVSAIALPAAARSVSSGLTVGQRGTRMVRHAARASRWIVGAQFAVATPVVYVLGLAAYSFHALVTTDLGFRTENVISAQVPLWPGDGFSFDAAGRHVSKLQVLLDRAALVPGVEVVAMSSDRLGFEPTMNRMRVRLREAGNDAFVIAQLAQVSAKYFDLLRIPVVSGRALENRATQTMNWADVYGGVVVDTTLAAALGHGQNVIGRAIILDFTPSTIIGVVKGVRSRRPDEPVVPRIYLSVSPAAAMATNMLVRFTGPAEAVRRAVGLAVQEEFATAAPADTVLLTDELARLQAPHRGRYQLLSLMGWIAVALCVAGIFAVGSYTVARRRRELAVRMAVGASRGHILWVCLRDLLVATAAGSAVGLAVGVFIGRQAAHLLYAVTPMDPQVLAGIIALLTCTVVAGALLPIQDAWQTDVSAVLRQE